MPFRSRSQQRFLESKGSPLSADQKREWEGATDFSALPDRAGVNSMDKRWTSGSSVAKPGALSQAAKGKPKPAADPKPGGRGALALRFMRGGNKGSA